MLNLHMPYTDLRDYILQKKVIYGNFDKKALDREIHLYTFHCHLLPALKTFTVLHCISRQ